MTYLPLVVGANRNVLLDSALDAALPAADIDADGNDRCGRIAGNAYCTF